MTKEIKVTDVSSKGHEEKGFKAYKLSLENNTFAHLHTGPINQALAFPGTVDFANLEQEAIKCLALASKKRLPDQILNKPGFEISFIVKGEEQDYLFEWDTKNSQDYEAYKACLKSPENIIFARYDLSHPTPKGYAFTTDNPNHSIDPDFDIPEITVSIPPSYHFTQKLLRWASNHHLRNNPLNNADSRNLSRTLKDLPQT